MILLNNDKQPEALEAQRLDDEQVQVGEVSIYPKTISLMPDCSVFQQEPPPTYASLQQASSSSQSLTQQSGHAANYVSLTRIHESLRETLTIDPTVHVPEFLLPPLSTEETPTSRKNLRLESTHGSISASVKIAPIYGTESCKVRMFMRSTHGGISARIVCSSLPLTTR
jgi:hypothetical protein